MAKLNVDTELLGKLADLMAEKDLAELEICEGERSLRLARGVAAAAYPAAPPAAVPAGREQAAAPVGEEAAASHPGAVLSPMVGTVYLSSQPGAPALVGPGDRVGEGQTLLIVEAMKVMNPILAPRAGTVTAILVEDAQPVEFGQPLLILE